MLCREYRILMVAKILDDKMSASVQLRFDCVNKYSIMSFNNTPDRVTGVHTCKWWMGTRRTLTYDNLPSCSVWKCMGYSCSSFWLGAEFVTLLNVKCICVNFVLCSDTG
jgi:hypothetical protein